MFNDRYGHSQYLVRRKIFQLFGASFHVFDPEGMVVLYSKQKAFKLREDIRVYASEAMVDELLSIQARQIVDFSAAYDVIDSATGEKVGALRRKGWSSIFRDQWEILDAADAPIGRIQEDSAAMALVRRFLSNLIPQSYNVEIAGQRVARFKQNFNPFVQKLNLDFSLDVDGALDRRLGLAAAVLIVAIEGRQQSN